MPLRVTCPSCGRIGKAPENGIGRTVRCPDCSCVHVLTADLVLPDDRPLLDDARTAKPAPGSPARPKARPGAESMGDTYELEAKPVEPPKRPVKPNPVVPVGGKRPEDGQPKEGPAASGAQQASLPVHRCRPS